MGLAEQCDTFGADLDGDFAKQLVREQTRRSSRSCGGCARRQFDALGVKHVLPGEDVLVHALSTSVPSRSNRNAGDLGVMSFPRRSPRMHDAHANMYPHTTPMPTRAARMLTPRTIGMFLGRSVPPFASTSDVTCVVAPAGGVLVFIIMDQASINKCAGRPKAADIAVGRPRRRHSFAWSFAAISKISSGA